MVRGLEGQPKRCGHWTVCGMLLISNLLLAGNLTALSPLYPWVQRS